MGIGRWIGGFLGFINGGPLGALAGYAIGWLFEKGAEGFSDNADNTFDNGTYRNNLVSDDKRPLRYFLYRYASGEIRIFDIEEYREIIN